MSTAVTAGMTRFRLQGVMRAGDDWIGDPAYIIPSELLDRAYGDGELTDAEEALAALDGTGDLNTVGDGAFNLYVIQHGETEPVGVYELTVDTGRIVVVPRTVIDEAGVRLAPEHGGCTASVSVPEPGSAALYAAVDEEGFAQAFALCGTTGVLVRVQTTCHFGAGTGRA